MSALPFLEKNPETSVPGREPQYYYCFERVLEGLARHMTGTWVGAKVSIVLEKTPKVTGRVNDIFKSFLQEQTSWSDYFTPGIEPQPIEGWPQLQAADVLAWEMITDLKWNWNPNRTRGTRASFRELGAHCDRVGGEIRFRGTGDVNDPLSGTWTP
jgi:hypothetical protein